MTRNADLGHLTSEVDGWNLKERLRPTQHWLAYFELVMANPKNFEYGPRNLNEKSWRQAELRLQQYLKWRSIESTRKLNKWRKHKFEGVEGGDFSTQTTNVTWLDQSYSPPKKLENQNIPRKKNWRNKAVY